MVIHRVLQGVCLPFVLLWLNANSSPARGQSDVVTIQSLVESLDSESFAVRKSAADQLRYAGIRESLAATEKNDDGQHDVELARLLNPRNPATCIRLDGWSPFAAIVGDGMPSRNVFAMMSSRFGNDSLHYLTPRIAIAASVLPTMSREGHVGSTPPAC